MAEINTAESLRRWLRTCPAVSAAERFGVDFMGKGPVEYAIYASPSSIVYRTDILGEVYPAPTQELNYVFAARFPFSQDSAQNMENLGFFTDVTEWFYRQNQKKDFPEIAEGRVLSILPTLSPYVFDAAAGSGRYQIQLKIKYRRKPN